MGHSHSHGPPANYGRAFAIGIILNVIYVAVEACYGFWADSLALLSDAGHNAGDAVGLLLAWGGYRLSKIRPSERRTYGFRSSTILAALINALILLVAVGGIVWESVRRLFDPADVATLTVVIVASVGVVINTATALMFLRGRSSDLNIRGAFLHMAADAAVSLGVVAAGLVIRYTGWDWIDPASSLVIAAVIFMSTWGLLKDSINMALLGVPSNIELSEVRDYLESIEGVTGIHDLHIWPMSTSETILTAHLVKPDSAGDDDLLSRVCEELHERFGIGHTTIQLEREPKFCPRHPP